jgi:Ca2+-dependent lipid-binding protein
VHLEREKQEALRAPLRESLQKNGLRVYVEKAVNLAAADSNGFSDPYVVLSLYTPNMDKRVAKVKSKVIKKNLNPIWEEMLTLTHTSYNDLIVKVEVWDKDKITDDFLGQIVWPFEEIFKKVLDKGEVVMPFALKDKKGGNTAQGEVYLKFVFKS